MKNLLYILLLSPLLFIYSCEDNSVVHGCLDSQACNYNPEATIDNNSCEYAIEGFDCYDVEGCTDSLACNFNSEAIADNNSCEYPQQYYDCDGNLTECFVGMEVEGGIVFYIDDTGEHGLVAAMEDLSGNYEWGCALVNVNGADGTSIGTGYQNTLDIVNQGCSTYNGGVTAAQAAVDTEINGYSDWFLPSLEELQEMYHTIGQGSPMGNIGGFLSSTYWSSSEDEESTINATAFLVSFFYYGISNESPKGNTHYVRVIRAF